MKLDELYRSRGLRIIAFPSDEFGEQEFDDADEIDAFVTSKGVRFILSSTITEYSANLMLLLNEYLIGTL